MYTDIESFVKIYTKIFLISVSKKYTPTKNRTMHSLNVAFFNDPQFCKEIIQNENCKDNCRN